MPFKKKLIAFPLLIILLLWLLPSYAAQNNSLNRINHSVSSIIIPLPEESVFLQKNITHEKEVIIDGITYHIGTINNKNIVFVNSGLGKVNSAIVATGLIRNFHPDIILMAGSSGNVNPRLKKFDVIIGKEVVNVDLGEFTKQGPQFKFKDYLYNPHSRTSLPMTFKLNDTLANLIIQITQLNNVSSTKVSFGKIATSDALPNPLSQVDLLCGSGFDVVEMEGASLMQVCWLFKTPCVVIRGVSNNLFETITKKDIMISAEKASRILMNVIAKQNLRAS